MKYHLWIHIYLKGVAHTNSSFSTYIKEGITFHDKVFYIQQCNVVLRLTIFGVFSKRDWFMISMDTQEHE
jgi:hypothetical protein